MKQNELPCSERSENDLPGDASPRLKSEPEITIKYKPDAGTVSCREVDLIMSILDDVLAEVERRCAMQTAHPAPEESSPCMPKEELARKGSIQPKRTKS